MTPIGPIAREERMSCLDTLRGFALLGILPANVLIFGMYFAAAHDLTVAGGATGANLVTWALVRILIDGKMRCLFSMVFGASTILLTTRAEERYGAAAADIYYRRTLWLLLFGLAHAFLLFWGDILYPYALCALLLFPFRKLSAKKLLAIGALFMLFNAAWSVEDGYRQTERRRLAAAGDAAQKAGKTPSDEQIEAKKAVEAQRRQRKPSPEDLEKEAKRWRGSPLEAIAARARELAEWHALPYYDPVNCDMWSMMFIGMGLFKLGVFSGRRSYRDYARIAFVGYFIGIPMNAFLARLEFTTNFDRVTHAWIHAAYDIERLSVALAHMAALMLLCKAGLLRQLTNRLAAIGQTALSNYILHSVVCTFVFTGFGLGLYGRLQRYQLYYVVAACWAVSLAASPVWLRHYRYGPLEWCWRSLTYWRRLPMRVRRPSSPADAAGAVA
jgi:uncharacterized protein